MYAGFDLSLNSSGVVLIDDSYAIITKQLLEPPKGCKGVERLYFLENILIDFLTKYDITNVCIEGPSYGSGSKSSPGRIFEIGEWTGIVKLNLFKKNIPFFIAVPSQLKKYVLGHGKGKKEKVMLDVFANFKEYIDQDDQADAYVLSRISRDYFRLCQTDVMIKKEDLINTAQKLHKAQVEVMKALQKTYKVEEALI